MIFGIALLALSSSVQAWQPSLPLDVFSYQCSAYFPEGEGVSSNRVDCRPHQHLGLLATTFTHYLGANAQGSNFSAQQRDSDYQICRATLPRVRCGEIERRPEFTLSTFAEGPFQVPVSFLANASGAQTRGFAAAVDHWGQCPFGLERIELFQSTIENNLRLPLPSSLPLGQRSSDWIATYPSQAQELERVLVRFENTQPCDERGDCRGVSWGEGYDLAALPFRRAGQSVCILPR